MRSNIWKSTFREIRQSFGRFMAIFAITALGVSLFAGLKVIQPAMVKTTDGYYKEKEFYDYRILSTLGFEEEDREFFASQEDVRYAEGIVSFDMLCSLEGESAQALKIYNLPERINGLELLAGRLPESSEECVMDAALYGEECIGKTICLSEENEKEELEHFSVREYTITGIAQSSNYIQFERGTTSIGNGKIAGFLYIPKEAFDVDYFTEILVCFDQENPIYSDAYEAFMDKKEPVWEKLAETAGADRYDRIFSEANMELQDAKAEFQEEKQEAEAELADAKAELLEGYEELSDADTELQKAKKELADGRKELEENKEALSKAEYELGYNRVKLESAQKEIKENRGLLEEKSSELEDGKKQLEAAQSQLDTQSRPLYEFVALQNQVTGLLEAVSELQQQFETNGSLTAEQEAALTEYENTAAQLLQMIQGNGSQMPTGSTGSGSPSVQERILVLAGTLQGLQTALEQQAAAIELDKNLAAVEKAQKEIDANRATLLSGEKQLDSAWDQLEQAEKEIEDGFAQLKDGIAQWEDGMRQLSQGEAELLDGEAELAKAEKELLDGWAEYEDGKKEYEDGYAEFVTEIRDAEKEISDAEQELLDMKKAETYLLGRETNVGYVCMENDSAIVDGIANVFPVFFYAVAALVCMTTMSRMIEEQRTQIGVFKALGYSEASIMGKYLFYSGSAAILGCLFGYFFGTWFFPIVIWYAYSSMYDVAEIVYVFDGGLLLFSLAVSALCSMGVTFVSCKSELSSVAAELMRPKTPKAGKRIFLEYIPFVWERMKFLHKVSYRNVFRYKKRFFMMVIGISGCTGLLVTGFGVQDSIANIANDQYGRIQIVDINGMLNDEVGEETDFLLKEALQDRLKESVYVMEKSIDLVTKEAVKSLSLVAIDENDDISPYVHLINTDTGEALDYPKDGECVLSDQLAEQFDLQVGDTVELRDENNHSMELTLSGITENYLYNFVYMTTQTYEQYLGEKAEIKSIYLNLEEGADPHQATADLMKHEEFVSASVSSDAKERFSSMIESLDLLILVIIICAGFLAFIVLYNLTNINITERIREIATIQVLGFYKNETASYVFRENLILTAFGAAAGLGLGKLFHAFVMAQVKVDQVSFDVRILPESYIYSVLLTFAFAVVINLFMTGKLERINMTEALKSVD